jgi:2-polyprenyl-6-methoxyphenol hydroxylase-like FAD-dependent oxidoreductase
VLLCVVGDKAMMCENWKREDAAMTRTQITDVLIVGAGPVGLMLASDLARRSIDCRIIDQEPIYHTGRAGGLSPRTQEIIDDLGLLEKVSNYNAPIPWRFYDRDNQVMREIDPASNPLPATPDIPYPGTLHVSQQETESVLREHLASYGRHVELNCQLVDFTQYPDYVVASVQRADTREAIQARYLVGCDGGHSTVRKCAGISFEGETLPNAYGFAGIIRVSGLVPTHRHIWRNLESGLQLSLTPRIYDDTWGIVMNTMQDEAPGASVETLQRLFDQHVGMPDIRFSDPTWISVFQSNKRMVDRYRSGRILLAGDAAHVGVFFGMQTGIQDAYNLGWKLDHALCGAPDALLDTYQAERLPIAQDDLAAGGVAAGVQAVTKSLLNKETSTEQKPASAIPNAVILSQLGITYRGSPLARDLDNTTGIRAGDRAPDAPCVYATNGEQVRLFDLFRGTHFTLLVFGDQPVLLLPDVYNSSLRAYTVTRPRSTTAISDHILIDSEEYASHAYGITGDALILVRPDGYIGLTGGSTDLQPIIDYLHDVTSLGRSPGKERLYGG